MYIYIYIYVQSCIFTYISGIGWHAMNDCCPKGYIYLCTCASINILRVDIGFFLVVYSRSYGCIMVLFKSLASYVVLHGLGSARTQ